MKRLLVFALAVALVYEPAEPLFAKGGSSFSGGGGRSSFSGGSSGRSSFSGGSSSSGGSRSSGGSSSSSGRSSFSGGSSSKPAASTPARSTFSGGSASKPSTPAASPSTFSGGSSSKPVAAANTAKTDTKPVSVSAKPAAPTFDTLATADARKAESRANYERATAPAPTYKTPKGEAKPINAKDPQVEYLRGRLDEQRWTNRYQRQTTFYHTYVGPSYMPIYYSDPYHGMFNYWLLDRSLTDMSLFIYHHQAEMDRARVRDLYAKNADLEAKVNALQKSGLKAIPTWYPDGVEPDLVYNDDYITATYNPKPRVVTHTYSGPTWGGFWFGVWVCIKWTFCIVLTLALVWLLIYLLFERRY
jgi:hypothetical protein